MSRPNKQCQVGDIVAITFDDHSEGDQHIVFTVYGKVRIKSRRAIVLSAWHYADSDVIDDNVTCFTVIRAAIRKIQVFSESPDPAKGSTSRSTKAARPSSVPLASDPVPDK